MTSSREAVAGCRRRSWGGGGQACLLLPFLLLALCACTSQPAERNGSGNEHGSGDNALQTLHGLLSFG